jgi:hypothetical protein
MRRGELGPAGVALPRNLTFPNSPAMGQLTHTAVRGRPARPAYPTGIAAGAITVIAIASARVISAGSAPAAEGRVKWKVVP